MKTYIIWTVEKVAQSPSFLPRRLFPEQKGLTKEIRSRYTATT